MARYPRTTPAISTASLPVLARRFLADPHEVGRIEGIGLAFFGSWSRRRPGPAHRGQRRTRPPAAGPRSRPDTSTRATSFRAGDLVDQGQRRPRAGHSRRLWERLWERRLELGANTYGVRVPPTSTERSLFAKRESAPGSRLVFNALSPHWRGPEDDKDGQEAWFTASIASLIG